MSFLTRSVSHRAGVFCVLSHRRAFNATSPVISSRKTWCHQLADAASLQTLSAPRSLLHSRYSERILYTFEHKAPTSTYRFRKGVGNQISPYGGSLLAHCLEAFKSDILGNQTGLQDNELGTPEVPYIDTCMEHSPQFAIRARPLPQATLPEVEGSGAQGPSSRTKILP